MEDNKRVIKVPTPPFGSREAIEGLRGSWSMIEVHFKVFDFETQKETLETVKGFYLTDRTDLLSLLVFEGEPENTTKYLGIPFNRIEKDGILHLGDYKGIYTPVHYEEMARGVYK